MSNISKQHDGDTDIQTNEIRNVSKLIGPTISCWEAGRRELTRARLREDEQCEYQPAHLRQGLRRSCQRPARKRPLCSDGS
jgi:hypothetical protein